MAFARPIPNANGELIRQRFTELSDVIRAKNKREDRLLNARVKFYEHQKNIRLNILRKEQRQLERMRTSLCEEANKIQHEKQTHLPLPAWISNRAKSVAPVLAFSVEEFTLTDWGWNSDITQSEIVPSTTTNNTTPTTKVIRPQSAR